MEMVGKKIWIGSSSETLSQQSLICEQMDTSILADTRLLESTSSRKDASTLQLCIRDSTPLLASDDSFSVHILVTEIQER